MSTIITIGGVDQVSGTLRTYVGNDIRGNQDTPSSPPFGAYAGKSIFQITVYANAGGELVTFRFTDSAGTETSLAETLTFVVNGNEGSVTAPFTLTASSAGRRRLQTLCGGSWDSALIGHLKQAAATVLSVTAATVSPYLA